MVKYKLLRRILFISQLLCFGLTLSSQSATKLWYNQAATQFEESLVLGNGKMGASVFGGVEMDKIYLNDATLWSGEPVDPNMNPEAYKNIPAIREALKNEDYKLADQLQKQVQGKFSESFAPLGTFSIDFKHKGAFQKYYRELNIADAISKVTYEMDGVTYSREYLVSNPAKVMVIKLSSNKKGALSFEINFKSLLKHKFSNSNNTLQAKGYAPVKAEPNYRGNMPNAVVFDEQKGTRFTALFSVKNTDGVISSTDSTISLNAGTEALVFISVATSFNGFDKNPATEGINDVAIAEQQIKKALAKPYETLKNEHLADYHHFFNRVNLNLGKTEAPDLPTDERLKRYAEGKEDKNLEILYFQYGRYLLISSSRTAGVPANLQGIWNPYLRPPWSSNYTTNINVEENYWLAENTNLSEMHVPMMGFIKNIATTGTVTAKTFFGVQNGWAACHNSDIWAMSNPVGDFGNGDPNWANWYMGGTWLSTHLWEHFVFTQDKKFLKEEGYPLMKGAVQFCLEWLVADKNGKLITSPSTSPEAKYINARGYEGATLYGSTADLAMIKELLIQTIKASEILDIDVEFRQKMKSVLDQLHPYQVGAKGHLQEWYYDWADAEPLHRHQTHLFGLYPGNHISPDKTPELANACRKTLELKGDETTGWSKGWRINLWARLWDGNHSYKMFRELLNYVDPIASQTNYSGGGGTYPNLFDAHPPFQIDGNFGGAAAVVEMLMQSSDNKIHLLPALPDAWDSGSINGICARGGFEVSMDWNNGSLKKIKIYSKVGGKTTLISGNKQKQISLKKGKSIELAW
ncbi:MAG TPA: glycoside hydrolase family 95 protein [Saprospiraceae bacterium]|nr:glycoside hydrolase family 95 protein [Saprospiraceae bacterium]HPN67931.1 glycoside hydrolase family 95 protein [Saprospiraceae bacterium]